MVRFGVGVLGYYSGTGYCSVFACLGHLWRPPVNQFNAVFPVLLFVCGISMGVSTKRVCNKMLRYMCHITGYMLRGITWFRRVRIILIYARPNVFSIIEYVSTYCVFRIIQMLHKFSSCRVCLVLANSVAPEPEGLSPH